MCGRQRCSLREEECVGAVQAIAAHGQADFDFGGAWIDRDAYSPNDNVSPGFATPVVHTAKQDEGAHSSLTLHTMRWGLVPSFTKKDSELDFWRMFNARSEGLATNNVFRRLIANRRCVVLSQGFYEWHMEHKAKQPYYIHLKSHEVLYFAGIYDVWTAEDGTRLYTYTIVTTASSPRLEWLHDRMPVLLRSEEACARWLRGPFDEVGKLLRPYDGEDLMWYRVTPAINRTGYRGDDCWKPVKHQTMAAFFGKSDGGASKDFRFAGSKLETVNADEPPGQCPPAPATDVGRGEFELTVEKATPALGPGSGTKVDDVGSGHNAEPAAASHGGTAKAQAQKRIQPATNVKLPSKKSKHSAKSDKPPGQADMRMFLKKGE